MSTTTPPRKTGRPNKGASKFRQVNIYLPPDMVEGLDRRIDREIQHTGHHVTRADVIRSLIAAYLNEPRPSVPPATRRRFVSKGAEAS